MTFESVRKIALTLPGVEESTSYGMPSFKVKGKLFACLPANRSAEPNTLVVRTHLEARTLLLETAPETYYLTDHYENYTAVLVRLPHITPDALKDLLTSAHKFVTHKPHPAK